MKTRKQFEDDISHAPNSTPLERITAELLLDIRELLMPEAAAKVAEPQQSKKSTDKKPADENLI